MEKTFDRVCREGCCLVGFKGTRCGRIIGKNCMVNVWNARGWDRVNDFFIDGFLVSIGLNQFSILNMLPILLSETLAREMKSKCQEDFLFAGGLALVNVSPEGFIKKLRSAAEYLIGALLYLFMKKKEIK